MDRRGLLGSLLLLASAACGPTGGGGPPGPGPSPLVPTQTAVGAETGGATGKTLAQGGGTFSSADGGLEVSVPAGAVSAETGFTVTPIVSTARGGVGPAYRLEPHGTTFAQPVTLTFRVPESWAARLGSLGVSYQDDAGYWHAAEVIARDGSARTVTVASNHFSDWALTWQTGTPAAEGDITLDQTEVLHGELWPALSAFGRATLHFQGDDAYDTTYVLTGTLTLVPATFGFDGATCTVAQPTMTLPLNVAEVHKGAPPVFRWGLGVTWSATCTDGVGEWSQLVPALFDTMSINLTSCFGEYAPGQIVASDRLAGSYTSDCGPDGAVTATWDLLSCTPGLACQTGVECQVGTTACSGGVQSCVSSPATDGTACGAGGAGTCTSGACVGG